jgi:YfiH family protein
MLDTREIILPTPGSAFEWQPTAAGPALVCRELQRYVTHLFTTNHWSLGLPTTSSDDRTAWEQVARAIDLTFDTLHRPRQVHSRLLPGDVIVTNNPLLGLAVQSADCVPLMIVDPTTRAVCAAHAGWRGLAAGVPLAAVQGLKKNFGSRGADLFVALGPSIGACCYEVGRDVRDAFAAGFSAGDLERWFSDEPMRLDTNPPMPNLAATRRPEHWFFDGWKSMRDQLEAAGVPADHICSYRRDGTPTGRMAAAIRSQPHRP